MKLLDAALQQVEEFLVASGLAFASAILFINVVLRYFFNSGWEWAEEAARYAIVWIVFLGGSICARKGMHLAVDALAVRLPAERQRLLAMLVNLLCVAFCVFLVAAGLDMVELARDTDQITPGLGMPIYYVYLAIPTGGALMAIRFAQDLYRVFLRRPAKRVTEAG